MTSSHSPCENIFNTHL